MGGDDFASVRVAVPGLPLHVVDVVFESSDREVASGKDADERRRVGVKRLDERSDTCREVVGGMGDDVGVEVIAEGAVVAAFGSNAIRKLSITDTAGNCFDERSVEAIDNDLMRRAQDAELDLQVASRKHERVQGLSWVRRQRVR